MNKDKERFENNQSVGNSFSSTNPITNGIIARINSLNNRTSMNKMYGNMSNPIYRNSQHAQTNYKELLQIYNECVKNLSTVKELFHSLQKFTIEKMNCNFFAVGDFHDKTNYINLKLVDKVGGNYNSRVFISESENPIVEAYSNRLSLVKVDSKFLNIPYLPNSSVAIIPLIAVDECIGVILVGDNNAKENIDIYNVMSNHYALFSNTFSLMQKAQENSSYDNLTRLHNHSTFQELLARELHKAEQENTNLSIVMMDINDISKVNRELGHAKGDEIIRLVADKIKENIRSTDIAGRYGGDEMALILPNTTTDEAKYIAEFLTYSLSCCMVDDVGPVKVSVGIATYPESTRDQEKLLILAEQAMYISQSKGYKDGMSAIISSMDFNFWDDMALNSFAEVLTKRHSQIGINFEEELVDKFNNEQIKSQNHLMEMVTSLASAIDAKDTYTKGHSTSVSRYSEALARAINLPEAEVKRITLGALLHDVGKIGIPENVLRKPTALSDDEWEIMKQHPVIGAEKVLMPNEALRDLIPIVKHHHEKLDGTGYPDRLKGTEIPFSARIVSIADAYHALISDRPYRKGMSVQKACEILKMGAGIQWDADLVRQFIQIAPSISTII